MVSDTTGSPHSLECETLVIKNKFLLPLTSLDFLPSLGVICVGHLHVTRLVIEREPFYGRLQETHHL